MSFVNTENIVKVIITLLSKTSNERERERERETDRPEKQKVTLTGPNRFFIDMFSIECSEIFMQIFQHYCSLFVKIQCTRIL